MTTAATVIFALVYLGVALGGVPGLALDRTGVALLGAIAMLAFGILTVPEAVDAVDLPTILLLYALMIISAQLRLGGFYTWTALQVSRLLDRPVLCLLGLMAVAAILSALLMNDIVCLAFTPVLCYSLPRGGINPVPYLLALAIASNIGSAATIIGNPQNMLIGQTAQLDFKDFFLWCAPPSLLCLVASFGLLAWRYRKQLRLPSQGPARSHEPWPHLDREQALKGLVAVVVMIAFFLTRIPRELSALTIAGFLLCSRKLHTPRILGLVDWNLITLFVGLFVVMEGFERTGVPERWVQFLANKGVVLSNPLSLTAISVVLSNIVSNVPATMLLGKFLAGSPAATWYILALATTYAGNLIILGSIANLIVVEQARRYDVVVTFREHATIGVPVTLVSILMVILWATLR